ncbi:hypothetical protein GCM10010168_80140 [Actinoplanes ianthinogenes]|uniref:Uncharacterized protein n=1 Tax=Actinoplanes ianthinogenes TaxID=122358 RepID=A0ABN6CKG9_9ACTN|nr:hypothetical protein [Actinoplanes ianthinogenes]BCJ45478.1 hypothetical protein Aiant_61350 [Actinoplanes ianthinogenes]GGR49319.1 hypothetical protein GCM10010168_80140 [Actinoplanes ianthinogenes]
MEPKSSPDNARPTPGLARFWQVRPDSDPESTYLPSAYLPPADEPSADAEPEPEMVSLGSRRAANPLEAGAPPLPTDLLTGTSLPFGPRSASAFTPVASARGPHGPGEANGFHGNPGDLPGSDPFGLNRAAGRGPGQGRGERGGIPSARSRHGDSDHSVPAEQEPEPGQDVESQGPEAATPGRETSFGGFRLGGTGRFLFGGRTPEAPPGVNGHPAGAESSAAEETGVAEPGDAQVAEPPADEESTGATPAAEPADDASPEAGQDAADEAGPRDENGREDMNGRAGAPGYAQAGDAPGPDEAPVVDGPPGEPALGEAADAGPAEGRVAAGWASVPVPPPTSGGPTGPVSGAPVSPGYAPAPYLPTDFTPDHPAGTLAPVSGQPDHDAEPPADPAASAAPVSPAPPAATGSASVPVPELQFPVLPPQIPATRTPADPPAAPDTGFAFGSPATTGYSLGRSGEAFGVASVTPAGPAAPQPGSVTPPPLDFQPYPESGLAGVSVGTGRRGLLDLPEDEPRPAARRSASLEDAEPVRRSGRRSAPAEEDEESEETTTEPALAGEETVIRATIWDDDAARHFRAAWHEVKAEFVDDPVNALTRAHDLLTDAVNELTEVLLAERDDLDPLRGTGTPDTESMRMAMRGYREFLDRILSL